jgi:3-oxoacyl-[acyl-carrier-protein] synthase III
MKAFSIRAISSELGELRDIGGVPELQQNPELLAGLREAGLQQYAHSSLTPPALALPSIKRTLLASKLRGDEIDTVVFATNSFWKEGFYTMPDVQNMLVDAGLTRAFVMGVFLSGCNNFAAALRTAGGLVASEGKRNVLVVCTDVVEPSSGSRILMKNVAVISDAALSLIVSPAGEGDFDVLQIGYHSTPQMATLSYEENQAAYVMGTIEGVRGAVDGALAPLAMKTSDVRRVFLNNYVRPAVTMLADKAGFAEEQCHFENIARFAHAYAADALINVVDAHRTRPFERGETALLIGSSPTNWGAVLLQKT